MTSYFLLSLSLFFGSSLFLLCFISFSLLLTDYFLLISVSFLLNLFLPPYLPPSLRSFFFSSFLPFFRHINLSLCFLSYFLSLYLSFPSFFQLLNLLSFHVLIYFYYWLWPYNTIYLWLHTEFISHSYQKNWLSSLIAFYMSNILTLSLPHSLFTSLSLTPSLSLSLSLSFFLSLPVSHTLILSLPLSLTLSLSFLLSVSVSVSHTLSLSYSLSLSLSLSLSTLFSFWPLLLF